MADAVQMPDRRLRVLFITAWYPSPDRPMVGVFVREHARAVRRFAEVVVLHCPGAGSKTGRLWRLWREDDPELTANMPTYRVAHRDLPIPGATSAAYAWSALRTADQVVADGFQPDIVHAHIYESGVPAVLFGRRRGIPVVITEHSSDFPRRRLPPLQVLKARFAFGRAERVLPVSRALQQGIEAYGIIGRFTVVPNAVDTDLFRPSGELSTHGAPRRLIYVGSLVPVKGLDVLLQALALLRVQRQDWRLEIMGDGPERKAYEKLCQELALADHVTFLGKGDKNAVARLMAGANLLVVPSRWENAPCVIIEAMACGLPVLATRIGGIPELLDEEVGLLVPPDDPEQMASGLDTMLHKLDRFDHDRIRRRAMRYGLDSIGTELRVLYEEIISQQHTSRSGTGDGPIP